MQTVSPLGTWSRATHESVSFWMDPDELPTDVEDVTEPASPAWRSDAGVAAADEVPTVHVDRSAVFDDEPPTRPDVDRVISVLRRRTGHSGERPVQAQNRAATPVAPPTRHVLYSRQVRVERPAPPVPAPPPAVVVTRAPTTVTVEGPVPLEYRSHVEVDMTAEYVWWLVGIAVGGFLGTMFAGLALMAAALV
ncbi:MAG: hypothetical protein H6737_28050 [Alphaproteobacteria bacterium]|nr:hypothetical protein [Alphaproteobacteria bacterium]